MTGMMRARAYVRFRTDGPARTVQFAIQHGRGLPSPDEAATPSRRGPARRPGAAPRMHRRPGRDAETRAAPDAAARRALGRAVPPHAPLARLREARRLIRPQ